MSSLSQDPRRVAGSDANTERDRVNFERAKIRVRNDRRNRADKPDELWVIQPAKAHESRTAGYAYGRVKLENVPARYRRKLRKRIRSINERRVADLAEANPNRALLEEVNESYRRQAQLEQTIDRLRDDLKEARRS